ncbi:MAG: hypothetical protein JO206_01550, partial [Solirubrobacterales bacterium]|nr:hypothetical protein [Solirubrobacterales bacterium]
VLRLDGGEERPFTPAVGGGSRVVHEHLLAEDVDGQLMLCCRTCGHALSDYQDDYRLGALVRETTLPEGSEPAGGFLDRPIVLRRFCCPGCATLLGTEIARRGEPLGAEMRLAAPYA